jgi:hypothetical protein
LAIGFAAGVSGYIMGVAGRLRCADAFGNYTYLWAVAVPIISLYFVFAPSRPNASETRFPKIPFFNGLGALLTLTFLAITASFMSVVNSVLLKVDILQAISAQPSSVASERAGPAINSSMSLAEQEYIKCLWLYSDDPSEAQRQACWENTAHLR